MKREEKNLISRAKIMDAARAEFADKGYGLSSVNTLCSAGDISKGILYHYFKDKDEIYLLCVQECFEGLTEHLNKEAQIESSSIPDRLNAYFSSRLAYFSEHPEHQRIFCEAVISPPEHLKNAISQIKQEFDSYNIGMLTKILSSAKFRASMSINQVVETFRQYQDFINARFQMTGAHDADQLTGREEFCHNAILILLYGVIEPDKET